MLDSHRMSKTTRDFNSQLSATGAGIERKEDVDLDKANAEDKNLWGTSVCCPKLQWISTDGKSRADISRMAMVL